MDKLVRNTELSNQLKYSKIKVDGHLNRVEIDEINNRYDQDKDDLFKDTQSGILKNLINKDYRKLSESLI